MRLRKTAPPLAAMLLTASAPTRPISLVVTPTHGGVELLVVGKSDAAVAGKFTLEVKGGGNTSVQRGTARLSRGQEVTLVDLRLGAAARRDWQARLYVELETGDSYEQVHASDQSR